MSWLDVRHTFLSSKKLRSCVSDVTLTKASLPSTAWAEVKALVTLSLAVMKERWVKLFSSSSGATCGNGTNTVRQRQLGTLSLHLGKKTNKQATQTSNSWLAILKWDDFTMSQTSRLFTIVPEIMKEKCVWVFQRCNYSIHLITTAHASHCMMLSLPLTFTLPRWRMAASSLEISQESLSVNMRIFRAERKWAYSFTSSRPSQLVHLPWWQDHMV